MNAIGVDVGGTKIAAGVVTREGEILNEVRYPSAGPRERPLSTIARAVNEVKNGFEVGGTCPPGPGTRPAAGNKKIGGPHLHAIRGGPLEEELEGRGGRSLLGGDDGQASVWGL